MLASASHNIKQDILSRLLRPSSWLQLQRTADRRDERQPETILRLLCWLNESMTVLRLQSWETSSGRGIHLVVVVECSDYLFHVCWPFLSLRWMSFCGRTEHRSGVWFTGEGVDMTHLGTMSSQCCNNLDGSCLSFCRTTSCFCWSRWIIITVCTTLSLSNPRHIWMGLGW